ncbi:CDK-activating kinase assembly factor [Meredithblackwellia eburnea MCA 4105]
MKPRFFGGRSGANKPSPGPPGGAIGAGRSIQRPGQGSAVPGGVGTATAGGEADDRRITEYSAPDDKCPVCTLDRQFVPNLRLMVSFCYHKMCESCMDRIFSLGPEPCPVCHVIIRKNQFRPQIFENLAVQKEVAIRKRTSKIFNKREEDFVDSKAYNDYLEEFEDLTFNLINNQDIEATEAKIRQYEAENRALIEANLSKAEREAEMVRLREEEERRIAEERRKQFEQLDEEDRLAREEEKRMVVDSLESSTISTSKILSAARKTALKRTSARDALLPLPPTSLSSFKFFSNLAEDKENEKKEPENLLAELEWYDGYEERYDIHGRGVGYGNAGASLSGNGGDEGGFVVEEVWEKVIRSSVAGLFLKPLGEGEDGGADVEMIGA